MIYYILLFSSAMIWSLTFLLIKQYQKYKGGGIVSSLTLSLSANIIVFLMFYIKMALTVGNWTLPFSWFTFLITLSQAFVVFVGLCVGMKALKVGDMSIYSMFTMLGNIILPSVAGFLYGESICDRKIIGMVLMIISLLLSLDGVDNIRMNFKVAIYYLMAFIFNGMMGVLLTIHQKNASFTAGAMLVNGEWGINSDTYMTWYGLSSIIFSFVLLVILKLVGMKNKDVAEMFTSYNPEMVKENKSKIYILLIPVVYGLGLGFGDYFISIGTSPGALGSSLTFPIVNGGTILFSTIVGAIVYREKIDFRFVLNLIIVLCSTMLFMFAFN